MTIPAASMAGGAASHAATALPGTPGARSPSATILAAPGTLSPSMREAGATQLGRAQTPGTTGLKPAVAPLATAAKGPPIMLFALAGVVVLFLALGGGAFALTRGFGLFNRPAATHTVAPTASLSSPTAAAPTGTMAAPTATTLAGTGTPDRVASQVAALQETQAALQAAYENIKPTDTVIVGMWHKHMNQAAVNAEYVREILSLP
jgi:hypothetical protein